MALDFGILQPVNIGGQFMAGRQQAQEQAQRNELAQQQLAASRQQMAGAELTQRHTQMQMDQMQRDRDALTKLQEQFVANGKSPDLESNADAMIASGIQHYVDVGSKIKQKILEQKQFASIMGGGAPTAAPAIRPSVTPGAMGSGTFDLNAPTPVAPTNALAPAAAPVNALAPATGLDQGAINEMRRKRDQLIAMGTTQSIAAANSLDRDIGLASKTSETPDIVTMRALGYPTTQAGYQMFRDAQRQERMLTPAEEAQRVRIALASRPPAAPKEDKAPAGYRFTKTGELEAIPGGPAAKSKEPTVSEQNASYNINRVLRAATEIKDVTAKDPSALAPSAAEAAAQSVGMGGTANVARSSNRQIVYGAQRDALDALLYLATGAAYNKEQLQGAWDSYMPAYTDDAATKLAKQERLNTLLDDAKTRAGKAWTPKMETSMKSLMESTVGKAPAPAAGGVDTSNKWLK